MAIPVEDLVAPKFPLQRGPRGFFARSEGVDVIRENIEQILGTPLGSRVMHPTFGCDIERLLFEQNDQHLEDQLQLEVKRAIEKWEPRVVFLGVTVEHDSTRHVSHYVAKVRIKTTGEQVDVEGTIDRRV